MHYLLFYSLSADYLARRTEFRAPHLALAWQSAERGELILGGAVSDLATADQPGPNPDTALLLFSSDSPAVAEAFARADPYVTNGLVTHWQVRQWTTVAGPTAATPVRPT